MRKIIFVLSSLLLLLAIGCGGSTDEADAVPATAVPPQPTEPIQSEPEATEVEMPETEAEPETQTVAAKPQLIEFYANW